MPARPLPDKLKQKILRLSTTINPKTNRKYSRSDIAKIVGCSDGSVGNVVRGNRQIQGDPELEPLPLEFEDDGLPQSFAGETCPLPDAVTFDTTPFTINTSGTWGVISDVHIPFHDLPTLRLFIKECKQRGAVGVLLNGDIMDFYHASDHLRDPSLPALKRELNAGKAFISWLREALPRVRIVYRDGNHEERLKHYLYRKAPELSDLDEIRLPHLLRFSSYGIEYVTDRRLVMVGKLPVIHGHEYKTGVSAPVNPARGLYLRAKQSAMVSHHHNPSKHTERTVTGKPIVTWSIGCACGLKPFYFPYNSWSHGFAFVELAKDGQFHVDNLSVENGKIL